MKSLNITGTSEIVANWNVYMSDIKEKESNDAVSKEASITDKLTATFNVGLEKPGGYVVYDITVKNDGDMDAVLNLITNSEEDESIKFTVENIEEGDFLFARNEKTFQVRVEWDKNSESTPEGEVSFSLGLEYVQS